MSSSHSLDAVDLALALYNQLSIYLGYTAYLAAIKTSAQGRSSPSPSLPIPLLTLLLQVGAPRYSQPTGQETAPLSLAATPRHLFAILRNPGGLRFEG